MAVRVRDRDLLGLSGGRVEFEHQPAFPSLFDTAAMKPRVTKPTPALLDGTEIFMRVIQKPVLEGNITVEVIPIYAKQGFGKTEVANAIAHWVITKHGRKNVNVVISNDFRALQDNIDPTRTVQILFLDDALDSAFSRGGTPAALRDAIKDFMKTRHMYARAVRKLNGEEVSGDPRGTVDNLKETALIYIIIASQSFKGLEKQFRQGTTIFKSPLEEDKAEVSSYWHASVANGNPGKQVAAAWAKLFEVQRRKMEDGDLNALSTCIVNLPSRGPMILHIPMAKERYFGEHNRVMYEEKQPENQLARTALVTGHLAELFLQKHDPSSGSAKAYLRDFLAQYCLALAQGTVEDHVLRTEEWVDLALNSPASLIGAVLDRAKALKIDRSKEEGGTGNQMLDDDIIIDKVAQEWVDAGGDPTIKKMGIAKARLWEFTRKTYRQNHAFRQRATELEEKIMRAATLLHVARYGLEEAGVMPEFEDVGVGGGVVLEHEGAPEFDFDYKAWANKLPERKALRAKKLGKDPVQEKAKWTRSLEAWTLWKFNDKGRDELASTKYPGVTGRAVGLWIRDVNLELQNILGAQYEAWWGKMLEGGYRHQALRGVEILEASVGGGVTHEPDLVVKYADGGVDFWSLKCYSNKTSESFKLWQRGLKGDFDPELKAFQGAYREWVDGGKVGGGPRLCIAYRSLGTARAEFSRVYERPEQLTPTVMFTNNEIGQPANIVWRKKDGE